MTIRSIKTLGMFEWELRWKSNAEIILFFSRLTSCRVFSVMHRSWEGRIWTNTINGKSSNLLQLLPISIMAIDFYCDLYSICERIITVRLPRLTTTDLCHSASLMKSILVKSVSIWLDTITKIGINL